MYDVLCCVNESTRTCHHPSFTCTHILVVATVWKWNQNVVSHIRRRRESIYKCLLFNFHRIVLLWCGNVKPMSNVLERIKRINHFSITCQTELNGSCLPVCVCVAIDTCHISHITHHSTSCTVKAHPEFSPSPSLPSSSSLSLLLANEGRARLRHKYVLFDVCVCVCQSSEQQTKGSFFCFRQLKREMMPVTHNTTNSNLWADDTRFLVLFIDGVSMAHRVCVYVMYGMYVDCENKSI